MSLFARDTVILVFSGSYPAREYVLSAGLTNAFFGCLSISTYYLFAYKYWTASFAIKKFGKKRRKEQKAAIKAEEAKISGIQELATTQDAIEEERKRDEIEKPATMSTD